jgi:DNA-directed RNA polymerase subunit RPC12/RpoP
LLQPEPPKQETFAPAVIQAPVDEPLAIAEESSAIGGERHGEPQPAISFGLDSFSGVVPPPLPTPPPECKPAPAPIVTPPAPAPEAPKAEAGGTTVLIRYTCPKCKTQGMQAVDKVGTVVNCSNCGKAMRLVMKK